MNRRLQSILRALLIVWFVLMALAIRPAEPRVARAAGPFCTVGAGSGATYTNIQAAVNDTGCRTIDVRAGTYTENITINRNLTLQGAGARTTVIDGGLTAPLGVINIQGSKVAISGVTIRNGSAGGFNGGGIANTGVLTLTNAIITHNYGSSGGGIFNEGRLIVATSIISDNVGQAGGGGIYSTGFLTITSSTVISNTGFGQGGGIANAFAGTASLTGVTLSANTSGAIFNQGTLTITNGTISGNTADRGGGVLTTVQSSTTLVNVTVTGNSALSAGGGISAEEGATRLKNTIVANNGARGNCAGSLVVSDGHNLSDDETCDFTGVGDLTSVDPKLGPLRNNGGPTFTQALLAGSPAIDVGTNTGCPAADQRGTVRPADGDGDGTASCDIGAYESPAIYRVSLPIIRR